MWKNHKWFFRGNGDVSEWRRKGKETDERFLVFGFEGMSKHYLQKNVNSVFFYFVLCYNELDL